LLSNNTLMRRVTAVPVRVFTGNYCFGFIGILS
jgi:hypothetical protein